MCRSPNQYWLHTYKLRHEPTLRWPALKGCWSLTCSGRGRSSEEVPERSPRRPPRCTHSCLWRVCHQLYPAAETTGKTFSDIPPEGPRELKLLMSWTHDRFDNRLWIDLKLKVFCKRDLCRNGRSRGGATEVTERWSLTHRNVLSVCLWRQELLSHTQLSSPRLTPGGRGGVWSVSLIYSQTWILVHS